MKKLNVLVTKKVATLKTATVLSVSMLSTVALVGCQSTGAFTSTSASTSALEGSGVLTAEQQLQQATQAKAELKQLTAKQLRRSFSYQTDIELSNAKRRQALAQATPEQLASADDKNNHCDQQHDTAYVALLKKADKAGEQVIDDRYDSERASIKNTYLNCQKSYDAWYEDYYYGEHESGAEPEYLPNYDTKHTAKDVKLANTLDNYLFQPLSIQMTGSYRPLAGKISLMPMMSYRRRNLMMSVNQPIYLDFKNSDLYLWADTFASLNSELIDDKLGTQWKNKWLRIGLNDGSLSDDFSTELLKSYVEAMKDAYEQEAVDDFSYLSGSQLSSALPYLSEKHDAVVKNNKRVIRRELDEDEIAQQRYLFNKSFYHSITKKYPQLLGNTQDNNNQTAGMQEAKDSLSTAVSNGDFATLLVTQYLQMIKASLQEFENEFIDENGQFIHSDNAPTTMIEHFGIRGNKLLWMHNRYQLADSDTPVSESMTVDALTVFHPVNKHAFEHLPTTAQVPTTANSIDIKQYTDDLLNYYQQGGGTAIGKLIYQGYNDIKKLAEQYSDKQPTISSSEEPLDPDTEDGTEHDPEDNEVDASSDLTDNHLTDNDLTNDVTNEVTNNVTNTVTINTIEAEADADSDSESAECVLMSVAIEMMCRPDVIDTTNATEVASCEQEQQEMSEVYEDYCK